MSSRGLQADPKARDLAAILPGVEIRKGLVHIAGGASRTTRPGVYAGGDIAHGASTVVAAVADGMKAAREIVADLTAAK